MSHERTMPVQPAMPVDYPAEAMGRSAPAAAAARPAVTSDAVGKLTFGDDFNQPAGTGPNDKTWRLDNGEDPNNNNVNYTNTTNGVHVVDDAGATDGKALALSIKKVGVDAKGNPLFESARITSQVDPVAGHLQYGRVEARIKLSRVEGSDPVWPAFWMLGSDIN